MQKTLLKKSMNLFLCGILSTAVLLGGCGIGNTANTQKEEQPAAAVQQEVKLSGARNTPVVVAAQKVGPAVVGINSAKVAVSGVEGIGFAIPVNSAKPILDELAQHGRIARPYIGASLIDKDISARYGFDLDLHGGIFVMKIVTGGPVYNAGMRPGDIILTFDGAKVETVPELRTKLAEKKVGDTVAIVVLRAGIERTLQVTLQEMPEGN